MLKLRMRRWRCCNKRCERQTFVELLPEIVTPFAPDAARRRIASSFCPQRWRPTKRTLDGAHWHAHERRYDLAGGSVAFALISPGAFRRWRGRGVFCTCTSSICAEASPSSGAAGTCLQL